MAQWSLQVFGVNTRSRQRSSYARVRRNQAKTCAQHQGVCYGFNPGLIINTFPLLHLQCLSIPNIYLQSMSPSSVVMVMLLLLISSLLSDLRYINPSNYWFLIAPFKSNEINIANIFLNLWMYKLKVHYNILIIWPLFCCLFHHISLLQSK